MNTDWTAGFAFIALQNKRLKTAVSQLVGYKFAKIEIQYTHSSLYADSHGFEY